MSVRGKTVKKRQGTMAILAIAGIAIVGMWAAASPESAFWPATGSSRLVSVQEFPQQMGMTCAWDDPVAANENSNPVLLASLHPESLFAGTSGRAVSFLMARLQQTSDPWEKDPPIDAVTALTRDPDSRTLADTYPTYTSVAVNLQTDEVVLQDNNLWSTRVFNRLDSTPPGAPLTQPKRIIQGRKTLLEYNNGLSIDQATGDMYSVESDTGDRMTVFDKNANGDVPPKVELYVPHRAYGMTIDEQRGELYVTVEYPPEVTVYRKGDSGNAKPIRQIKGDHTGLETPHGIAIDWKNRLIFIANWGHYVSFDGSESVPGCCRNLEREIGNAGTAKYNLPSITVHSLDANGDTPPLRVIRGDRTRLNWPGNLSVDQETGDLYVANDVDQSILVFTGLTYQRGNVAPTRVIKGDRTGLTYPTGVFVDTQHQELWVSNLGNASAMAYPLKANGNVTPLRIIRSAPPAHRSMTFGRTAAVAYDTNREEILVPN